MRLRSLLECLGLIEMRIAVYDCKHIKTCEFSCFTVDGASDVNLKTHFIGNSKNSVGEAHGLLPHFTNIATSTVSDESEICRKGRIILDGDPGRHKLVKF